MGFIVVTCCQNLLFEQIYCATDETIHSSQYVVSSFPLVNLNLNTYTIKTITSSFLDLINYILVLVDMQAQNRYDFVSPISLTNCHFYSFTQCKAVFPKNLLHFTVYCCSGLSLLQCKLIKPLKLNKGILNG